MYNNKNPKITVLLPVYNCELYIKEAVDSILCQTFDDFELLIIDDASTDKTIHIIKTYSDERIKLIEKTINKGLTDSLNLGIQLAQGKYIARMDGDDVSVKIRFEKQVAFLELNPDVVLCGSNFTIVGTEDRIIVPENNEDIRLALLKKNCIAHPSVMIRKQTLIDFSLLYDETKEPAEDYDLWVRLMTKGKLHNLQQELLKYRIHNAQVSQKRIEEQNDLTLETRIQALKCLELPLDNNEINLLKKLMTGSIFYTFNEIEIFIELRRKMILANSKHFFEFQNFKKYFFDFEYKLMKRYFFKAKRFSPALYIQYFKIKSKLEVKFRIAEEFKLLVKSLFYYKLK